jgi:hypothetical protein
MKVESLDQAIRFYSTLFASEPTVVKPDYAKWMLEDPRVNFAISTGYEAGAGLSHLGIQVESAGELQEVYGRLKKAEAPMVEEGMTTCCYAKSEKSWIADPAGVAWEAFHTVGESTTYGTPGPWRDLFKADGSRGSSAESEPSPTTGKACCG